MSQTELKPGKNLPSDLSLSKMKLSLPTPQNIISESSGFLQANQDGNFGGNLVKLGAGQMGSYANGVGWTDFNRTLLFQPCRGTPCTSENT